MSTRKIADATVEPLTLEEAKAALRVEDDHSDAEIESLIRSVRIDCENRLGRSLIKTEWEMTLDRFPLWCEPDMLRLIWCPVMSVDSITYVDVAGDVQTLAPSTYVADVTSEPGRVALVEGRSWPAIKRQPGAVRVRYSAGYGETADEVPEPLKTWMILQLQAIRDKCECSGFVDRMLHPYLLVLM